MCSDVRREQIQKFVLDELGAGWQHVEIPSDASARRYTRLRKGNRTAILMDADPNICGSSQQFVKVANHLRNIGLSSPDIFAADLTHGLLLLEDLGETSFANWIKQNPNDERELISEASQVISVAQSHEAKLDLTTLTPNAATNLTLPFWTHYAPDMIQEGSGILAAALTKIHTVEPVFCFRDFHVENLIWRTYETSLAKIGVLDFQDALLAHPIYDYVSILRDARRDISEQTVTHVKAKLSQPNIDIDASFSVYSVQRNLRILGVFHDLIHNQKKLKYRDFVGRVSNHIRRDIMHPDLAELAKIVGPVLP